MKIYLKSRTIKQCVGFCANPEDGIKKILAYIGDNNKLALKMTEDPKRRNTVPENWGGDEIWGYAITHEPCSFVRPLYTNMCRHENRVTCNPCYYYMWQRNGITKNAVHYSRENYSRVDFVDHEEVVFEIVA